jgi:integrase
MGLIVQQPEDEQKDDIVLHEGVSAIALARANLVALDERADRAAEAAVPANTRRAYELEVHCFASWCVRHGLKPSPVEPRVARAYLRELADSGRVVEDLPRGRPHGPLGYSALMRTLSALCTSNVASGHPSIWKDSLIVEARKTLARDKTEAKRKKRALGSDEGLLFRVCDVMDDSVRGIRDRALILVGFHAARRRSEIVAAQVEDFQPTEAGHFRWTIRRSKTDQTGKGHVVLLPLGEDGRYCPVRALRRWLDVSKVDRGPVFRGVDMVTGEVMQAALAPEGVAKRIQHYVKLLGLDPRDFGGHSLRSGFVTTAARAGKRLEDIMDVTGHRDPKTVIGYIRQADLEDRSVAKGLLDEALARKAASNQIRQEIRGDVVGPKR